MEKYVKMIGLEVHIELLTKHKIFCNCKTEFGGTPNTNICPVCMGMPGAIPTLNMEVVKLATKAAKMLNCTLNRDVRFDRKNYFYPDNPQNYQITQFYNPIGLDGYLSINNSKIRIKEMHMEEDAGKLIHTEDGRYTCIDYNRAGVPLIEIVTMPDMNSDDEVIEFLEKLKDYMEYLGVSDCKMNEGSMRVDVNLSVISKEKYDKHSSIASKELSYKELSTILGARTEMKNLNSFRSIRKAIECESKRQIDIIENGGSVNQETRGWNESINDSIVMRSKEDANDYRYFPEPNIVHTYIDSELLNEVYDSIPEMRDEKILRYVKEYKIPEYDAKIITQSVHMASFFEDSLELCPHPKKISNWIMGELLRLLNEKKMDINECLIRPYMLAEIIQAIEDKKINTSIAKSAFECMFLNGISLEQYLKDNNIEIISSTEQLRIIVIKVIENNEKSVQDYKSGKKQAAGYILGQTMKELKGQANPQQISEIIGEILDSDLV